MGKDYAAMTTAALQHRNCFLMGKLGRARRGKLQAPPEKVEAWRREADEVTEETSELPDELARLLPSRV